MMNSRPVLRAALRPALRTARPIRSGHVRFQSNETKSAATGLATVALGAGAVGGAVAYGVWYFSPAGQMARQVNKAAYSAHAYYKDASKTFEAKAPSTDDAINAIRSYVNPYASWVPGGKGLVDTAFNELDQIRQDHGQEVDDIVRETYEDLQTAAKGGLSMETARRTVDAFNKLQSRLVGLVGGNISDLLEKHPMLRNTIGQPVQQLKQMGESMGPEIKKEVDETWEQLRQITQGGLNSSTFQKAKDLIQEKTDKLRKLGDEGWKQGLEKAKPYLDKNPKVKELLEKNESALKSGNLGELFQKVKSGDAGDLESYIKDTTEKAKSKSSGLISGMDFGMFEQYAKMIPGGDQIVPRLTQLKDLAANHREEGENLLNETVEEIRKVLHKQSDKAQQLAEKASK